MGAELRLDRTAEVITVSIARPPENAFTADMCSELSRLLMHPPDGCRLVVLRGEDGVFCRGRDGAPSPQEAAATIDALTEVTRSLRDTSLVTVAEVAGDAAGFGVGLAALCDVTAASSTSRFWFPEVHHELAPSLVLSWLPRLVGRRQAFWLTATGAVLAADEAQRLGLVNFVTETEHLDQLVAEVVQTLLKPPARVHAEIKRDLRDFDEAGASTASRMATDRLLLSTVTSLSGPR